MGKTNKISSETPCPFCGCSRWFAYFLQDDGVIADEDIYSDNELLMYPALIDLDYEQYESIQGAVDECMSCGATIGI